MRSVRFASIQDNQVFFINGVEYVRIPTLRLSTTHSAFICNCIRLQPSSDEYLPDIHITEFIHEECEVEIPRVSHT